MTRINKKRVLFVTGSTAGHVWPAVWVAKYLELQKKDVELYFYISGSIIERKILKGQNFKYTKIYSGKWRRYFSLMNFTDIFKIVFGLLQSIFLLILYRPKIIFIKGGSLGVPVAFAATILGIPYVNHESDARLGLANKIISRFSKIIFVAFPEDLYCTNVSENKIKIKSVGIPLAPEFNKLKNNNNKVSTILFLGGSLGSKKINDSLKPILQDILTKYKVIHICGQNNLKEFQNVKLKLNPKYKNNYKLYGFVEQGIANIIQMSDLVVSRAGATIIFELASLAKPVILIPLGKKVSRGDQEDNCKIIQRLRAAIIINNEELSPNKLQQELYKLINNPDKLNEISTHIKSIAQKNSSEIIYNHINQYL